MWNPVKSVLEAPDECKTQEKFFFLNHLRSKSDQLYTSNMQLDNDPIIMEIDNGTALPPVS